MRLVPSVRHALAAVALAALAAGSAPAADYYLLLKDVHGVTSTTGLQSFSWGASQGVHATGAGGMGSGKVNFQDISVMKRIAVSDPGADGPKTPKALAVVDGPGGGGSGGSGGSAQVARIDRETAKLEPRVAAADLDGDGRADVAADGAAGGGVAAPRDSASGLPTGKRQHGQVKLTTTLDKSSPLLMQAKPAAAGSLTVAGSLPRCAVGATYPEATLEGAGKRYELKEVMITSCATGQLSLDYARVEVRGWDVKKKDE